MNYDPNKAIRQALMVARRQAAYGGQQSYPGYRPINPLTGLPEDEGAQVVGSSAPRPIGGAISGGSNDPGTPGPPGAPSTGNFGRDVAGFAEATAPAMAGAAIGAAMGGPAGAIGGLVGATMAQGLAEATGLSAPATSPPGGFASVAGNIAQTQMGMTPTSNPVDAVTAAVTGPQAPADQEDADQGAAQSAAAAAAAADNANSMSEAATADAAADSDGGTNGDSGGAGGDGDGGGGGGFARGGNVKGGMDPRSLPGIHLKTDHRFADGGGVQPEEEEGFDAYHGSPHEFERFDSSKIGTGEGVQQYGYGHYLTDTPDIARGYRDTLLGRADKEQNLKIGKKPIENIYSDLERQAAIMPAKAAQQQYDKLSAIETLMHHGDALGVRNAFENEQISPETMSWMEKNILSKFNRSGALYHVRVKAKPEHFLDWDAPLSEQHPQVVQTLDQAFPSAMDYWRSVEGKAGDNGGHFHAVAAEDLSGSTKKGHEQIAAKLQAAGIPGIKYFDRDSRNEGKGTRNYVIFDPDMIQVKRRYADGGQIMPQRDLDSDPAVQQALDITRQAQMDQPSTAGTMQLAQAVTAPGRRRFEIAPARVAPATIADRPRDMPEEGSVTIKRLTDAFKKAIDNHLALPPAEQIANARQAENNVAQYVGRGKTGKINSVLTANKKLMKAQTAGEDDSPLTLPDGRTLEMTGLALMPDYREGQFKMCGNSDVCRDLCLGKESGQYRYDPTATQAQMPTTKEQLAAAGGKPRMAAFRRTMAMMRDPESFAVYLHELIDGAKIMAEKRVSHLGVRLNVLSDLSPKIMEPIIKAHPDVSFYDYTKMNYDPVADNHHYTYSSTGLSQPERGVENPFSNWRKMRDRLDQGHNVAMAFAHGKSDAFPEHLHDEETGKKYRVVSGDEHDFRPMDMVPEGEAGVIIALKNMAASNSEYKYENAARNSHGFFVHHEPDFERTPKGTFAVDQEGNRIPRNKVYTVPVQPMKRGAMRQQEN